MKSPARPLVVEIKRRGRKVAIAAKASIWPDPSVFREIGKELDPPAIGANAASPGPRTEAKPMLRPQIIADGATGHVSSAIADNARTKHEMAKSPRTKATKAQKSPYPVASFLKRTHGKLEPGHELEF